jgi:hypothetical protein
MRRAFSLCRFKCWHMRISLGQILKNWFEVEAKVEQIKNQRAMKLNRDNQK